MVSSVLFNAEATNRKWGRAALTIRKYKDSLCKTRHLGIYNDDFKGKNANIGSINFNFEKRWKPIMLFLMVKKAI